MAQEVAKKCMSLPLAILIITTMQAQLSLVSMFRTVRHLNISIKSYDG